MEVHFGNDFISERLVSGGGPGVFLFGFAFLLYDASKQKSSIPHGEGCCLNTCVRLLHWAAAQCIRSVESVTLCCHTQCISQTQGGQRGRVEAVRPAAQNTCRKPLRRRLCLQSLLAIAAVAVPTAAGLLLLQPLLFRRLQVRHILTVLPQHTAPVHLAAKPLQGAIDGLVVAYFYTYSQSGSLVIPI